MHGIPLINVTPVSCWELVLDRWSSNRYREAEKKERKLERDKRNNKEPGDAGKGMNLKHERDEE